MNNELGIIVFAVISNCRVEECFPTIYNVHNQKIVKSNSTGKYVNITKCPIGTDGQKKCSTHICKIVALPYDNKYDVKNESAYKCQKEMHKFNECRYNNNKKI